MQGASLYRVAIRRIEQAVQDILKEFGADLREVKQVVLHQANGRILAQIADRLAIPQDRLSSVIERYGNTSSASLPIALDGAVRGGAIASGDLVLLGSFGGGLTWATGLVRWYQSSERISYLVVHEVYLAGGKYTADRVWHATNRKVLSREFYVVGSI